jgi:predicted MFS family arabinose efflux permease
VFLGSTPVGGPIAGWVSETVGARWALGLGAVTSLLAGALTLRAVRTLTEREQPLAPIVVDPSPVVVAPGR